MDFSLTALIDLNVKILIWMVCIASSWPMTLRINGELRLNGFSNVALLNCARMNQTMERLKKMEESQYTTLARVLFGLESPSPVSTDPKATETQIGELNFFDPTLNDSQKDAIRFALTSQEIALIHGPPGVSLPPSLAGFSTDVEPLLSRLGRRIHLLN